MLWVVVAYPEWQKEKQEQAKENRHAQAKCELVFGGVVK